MRKFIALVRVGVNFWRRHSLKIPLPLMVNTCPSFPVAMTTSTLIHAHMYPDLHDNFMITLYMTWKLSLQQKKWQRCTFCNHALLVSVSITLIFLIIILLPKLYVHFTPLYFSNHSFILTFQRTFLIFYICQVCLLWLITVTSCVFKIHF